MKRFAAFLIDFMVLIILSVFFIFLLMRITNYDFYNTQLISACERYEKESGVSFSISPDEYNSYRDDRKAAYDRAYEDLIADEEAVDNFEKIVKLTLINLSLGVFLAFLTSEFIIPLILGNGITLGKKIALLCLMRKGGGRVNVISLFIRTVLGKYIIETLFPLLIVVLILFNLVGSIGPVLITAGFILNIILLFTTPCRQLIHDVLADTVVVDCGREASDAEKEYAGGKPHEEG